MAPGCIFLPALPVGDYTVTAELSGFRQFAMSGLTLSVGQKIELPMTLQIGQLSDTVTVVTEAPLLQTANAEIAEIIDNRQVSQLPLNGRQFVQLAQLTDGVTIPPGGTRGAALGQAGPLPNVYGQRGGHNIYLHRRREGDRRVLQQSRHQPVGRRDPGIQDSEDDVSGGVRRQGVGAHQRRHQVGRQPLLTAARSSSSATRRFDAHNYFDDPNKPIPDLRQNQFGVNVGGPIRRIGRSSSSATKDSGLRKAQTQTFSVPTAALRAGDFSGSAGALRSADAHRAGTCTPFTNNQIPANRISPVARRCSPRCRCRRAAVSCRTCSASRTRSIPMNQFSLKLDHRLGASDNLLRTLHHLSRQRSAAVRHDLAERGAGARIRAHGDDAQREPRARPHARVRLELAERGPLRLSQRPRRTGQPESGHRLRRRCPACRA